MNQPEPNQAGPARVDALNQTAWEVRVIDSNRAFALSEEAVALAQALGYEKGLAEALRTLGFGHIRRSQHPEARVLLEQARELFIRLDDPRGLSDVYEYLGIVQRSLGDYAASLELLFQGLTLRRQHDYTEGEALSLYHIGVTYKYLGDYTNALHYSLEGLPVARRIGARMPESYLLNSIGGIYYETGDLGDALNYYQQSLTLRQSIGDQWGEAGNLDNMGAIYRRQGEYEKALEYCLRSLAISESIGDLKGQGNALFEVGRIHAALEAYAEVLTYGQNSLRIREGIGDKKGQAEVLLLLGELYGHAQFSGYDPARATNLLTESLRLGRETGAKDVAFRIHLSLAKALKEAGEFREALEHFEAYSRLEKEVYNESVNQQLQNLHIAHRVEKARQEAEIYRLRTIELAELVEEIRQQRTEIETHRDQLEKTLTELKATQAQLIQKEKMASLGELTAGIAHEIQNPLNFVNNFSEVSVELLDELEEELGAGHVGEVRALADDLRQNLRKITHHGQRADGIVKGMLQHSRASTGRKQPTDLNALANEYLRLAYQGLRAKDQDFNATLHTDFDAGLGTLNVVPQDIGRVLLNLFNNAFYAVSEKQKQSPDNYQPTVSVSTKRVASGVEIRVSDNGTGMPEAVKQKIFQPFFTTKPAGQGTGLGLSLSYDIITKGHGGTIDVEMVKGTTFVVRLPISQG
ncbi:MAG: tetratricopeptide repeat protein [Cytophagaceae bacterium]|nr:tetratricopeptide repeat protein [Cytophagaceae bacterium]